jgi:5'-nucleotidase
MTRVLVTNDDGIDAPGIRWLAAAAVDAGMDVVVAAPGYEASGASAALSARVKHHRLEITEASIEGVDTTAFSVLATPSYIVVLANLGTFGPPPDLVLSGINRGANAGYAILHSGTVGAALTAANQGKRAIAVSLDVLSATEADPATGGASLADALEAIDNEALHWSSATHVLHDLIPQLAGLPEGTIVNVNVPNRPFEEIEGVRMAALAPFGQVQMAIAESGEGYIRTAIKQNSDRGMEHTDIALLSKGYATVTPVRSIRAAAGVTLTLAPPHSPPPSVSGFASTQATATPQSPVNAGGA